MNAQQIYNKRIEEAVRDITELCPDCDFHCKGSNLCIPKILYANLIEITTFVLNNQWISVKDKESLIEDIPNCFVAYKAMDMVLYSTGSYEKDNDEWYVDGVGFNAEVIYWMPIPQLEGGE